MSVPGAEKPGVQPPPLEPLLLCGTAPGLLDPSQSLRLLRHPQSRLSFANFDPFTASADNAHSSSSSSTDKCRSKRIVIETSPDGQSSWRWIPNARKDTSVNDEGDFSNRIVNVCGTLYRMTQDQWDIYKLDPQYDCCVKAGTGVPTILLKGFGTQSSTAFSQGSGWPSNTASMRTASPHSSSSTLKPDTTLKPDATMRTAASPSDHESDRMSVDDEFVPPTPTTPKRATREMPRRRSRPYPDFNFPTPGRPSTGTSSAQKPKRSREERSPESRRPAEDQDEDTQQEGRRTTKFYSANMQKRARTLSPNAKNRNMNNSKIAREKAKARRLNEQKERHKQQRQQFEQDTSYEIPTFTYENAPKFTDIPEEEEEEMAGPDAGFQPPSATQPESVPADEDQATRQRIIEESVRKLKEMNLNRPQEREREKAFKEADSPVEPKPRRAKTEAPPGQEEQRRRKFEAAMQEELRRKQELDEARRKEALRQQEQERRRAELRAKAAREREIRNQEWNMGYWDHQTALDRYKKQSLFFDKEKFSEDENPLMFTDVPWPTLTHPLMTRSEDLEYDSVTRFLEVARMYLQPSEFNSLVTKSRLRFHPDRWSNRRLLNAVVDVNERNEIQTIITTVSQAMNYVYDTVKPKQA